ncbi:Ras-related protein Rab [Acrasis kona]|uniref:Ras-related protein Rab n=1 Tax=Acrasis kona TaxID=1008807 RepID=A0AAW2Z0H8_9EUKA
MVANSGPTSPPNEALPHGDTLKMLYRRLSNRIIWKRSVTSHNPLDKFIKHNRYRRKSLAYAARCGGTFHLTVGVIGTGSGCGCKTIISSMRKLSEQGVRIDGIRVTLNFMRLTSQPQEVDVLYESCDGFFIVFSLIDNHTLNNIGAIRDNIHQLGQDKAAVLIGNKNDLIVESFVKGACVDVKDAINIAQKLKLPYIETNAKENINTSECLVQVVKEIFLNFQVSNALAVPGSSPSI